MCDEKQFWRLCRTITDLEMENNVLGTVIAAISVVSSGMQQIFCRTMQQKHSLASHELLANTAPAQVCSAVHKGISGASVTSGRHLHLPGCAGILLRAHAAEAEHCCVQTAQSALPPLICGTAQKPACWHEIKGILLAAC